MPKANQTAWSYCLFLPPSSCWDLLLCVLLLHYSTPTVGVSLEILTSLESCNWILCTDDLPTLFAIHFRGDFAISVVYIVIECNYMHLLKYCTLKILRYLYFTWVFPFCATLYVNSTSCWSKCCTLYFTSHQSSTFVNELILSAIRFLKKIQILIISKILNIRSDNCTPMCDFHISYLAW